MKEQIKKAIAILLVVLFVVTVTASAVSANAPLVPPVQYHGIFYNHILSDFPQMYTKMPSIFSI